MLTARDRKRKRSTNTKEASTVVQTVYIFFIDIIPPYVDRHSVFHLDINDRIGIRERKTRNAETSTIILILTSIGVVRSSTNIKSIAL